MKSGDMVRFAKWEDTAPYIGSSTGWHLVPKKHIGVLLEYDKLMQLAHVLHEGEIYKIRPVFVEKAGRKDFDVEEGE